MNRRDFLNLFPSIATVAAIESPNPLASPNVGDRYITGQAGNWRGFQTGYATCVYNDVDTGHWDHSRMGGAVVRPELGARLIG